MDRLIIYPGAIPLDSDLLNTQRNAMISDGYLMEALFGANVVVDGLLCTPTAPASMTVNVGRGAIYGLQTVDQSSFGSLTADSTDPLFKAGVNLTATPFTLTAPGSSSQSINYLIQATFQEADNTPVTLPYFNSGNPASPFSGPSNSGVPQNTVRAQRVQLQLKAGTPANTGTQATPAVDAGWTGIWVITVNFGQVTITAGAISAYPNSPFLAAHLESHHGGVPGQAPKINLATEVQGLLSRANIISSNCQAFTSSGTFTVPTGVTQIKATVTGGGGGGGGSNTTQASSGGGAGGTAIGSYSVSPGAIIAVTVGAGGAGGGTLAGGGTGGSSSLGALASATGGTGGDFFNSTSPRGGAGGVGSGGAVNLSGGWGDNGSLASTTAGGMGGASEWGGGGRSAFLLAGVAGAARGSGGGGSYGAAASNGGAGAGGIVLVEW